MAAYDSLKSLVQQAIRTNGNNEITGQVLQNVLMAMIDELGGENGYAGVATPSTNPGTPDGKVFYFATEAGTYTHFDGATLAKGIHLLVFNGVTWSHQTLYTIDSEVTSGSNNLITSGAVYTKIINAINALDATVSKSAGADGLSLSLTETDGKVTSISGSIAPQTYDAYGAASAAQIAASADATNKVNAAKTQILGDAASDYNTLGKLEDKIQAEESRAAAAENALNTDKADKATTLAGYGINDAYTKTEVNGLVSTPHQNYVTVPTYASLPATGSADTIYRVSNYNGSTSQVDASVYSEYAWNGSGYTFLRVDSQIGEVFDITVYNSNTKYADLAAALGTNGANVPSSIRRGGMSVKFVQSSDNKYVQFRLMSDEWSINTEDWAIADESVYVENPEFVYVKTDSEGKILWAIKADGSIYYGAGVPQQIKDYIEDKISSLSLDEYVDIVTFLSDYLGSDTTLKVMIDGINATKLDKEGLDSEALGTVQAVENSEYIQVTTDSEDKILEGITSDGVKQINLPIETPAVILQNIDNPDYIDAKTDMEGRIISCRSKDGTLQENVGIKTPMLASKSVSFNDADGENLNVNTATITTLNTSDSSKENITNTIVTKEKEQEFSLLFGQTTGQVESFIFFSDPHYFSSYGGGYDNCVLRSGALSHLHRMRDYFINTPTDFILCGGDWLEDHKQSIAIKDLGWIDGFMNKLFLNKYYPMFGNHDNNYQGELDSTDDRSANDGIIPNEVVANLWFRKYHKLYYSFKGTSSTFYIFNSGTDWNTSMDSYRWEQVDWFGQNLLNNEDEHIIIGIHIVTNGGTVVGENIAGLANNITLMADAFNSRTSITLNDKTYNFANVTGTVHCVLCGHKHIDGMATVNNIPVMWIDDAMEGNFDLVLVDYGNNILKTIRVGTGTDRVMNLV